MSESGRESGRLEAPRPGQTIDRFVVEGGLGRETARVSVRVRDPELDRELALELARAPEAGGGLAAAKARIEAAAASLARAPHPNLLAIHDCGTWAGALYFTTELIEGRSLRASLAEQARPWREIVASFCLAAQGLAAAHERGLIHGAVRAEEIILGERRVVLGGFGLVPAPGELEPGHELSELGHARSSMAPEQLESNQLDARSDQYALCAALWEALFEQPPFPGDGEPEDPGPVPASVREILRRGLSREPEDRWPDVRSLAEALDASLREPDASPSPPGGPRWLIPAIIVAAALIAALAMIWAVAHPFREPPPTQPTPGEP